MPEASTVAPSELETGELQGQVLDLREDNESGVWNVRIGELIARNRFLITFALMSSFLGTSVGIAQVTTSLYAAKLGCSEAMLGLIAGSQSVGVLVTSLPIGLLVERFGPARLFVVGTVVSGAIYAFVPLGTAPGLLLACTTIISFFMPMRFVSLNTIFLKQLTILGESKAGWYRGTHMIGMFLLGPAIAPWLIQHFGFTNAYWVVASTFALTLPIASAILGPYGDRPNPRASIGIRQLGEQIKWLFVDRELRKLSVLESLNQGVGAYFTFFIIVIAVRVAHLDASHASSLVSAKGVTYIAALFLLGGITGRLGRKVTYMASFAILAVALAVLGVAVQTGLFWLGALLLGVGLGTLQIANLTGYARVGQRAGHGRVSGLNALAGPAGALVANLSGGIIGGMLGLQSVFLVLAAVLSAASFWILGESETRARTNPFP